MKPCSDPKELLSILNTYGDIPLMGGLAAASNWFQETWSYAADTPSHNGEIWPHLEDAAT